MFVNKGGYQVSVGQTFHKASGIVVPWITGVQYPGLDIRNGMRTSCTLTKVLQETLEWIVDHGYGRCTILLRTDHKGMCKDFVVQQPKIESLVGVTVSYLDPNTAGICRGTVTHDDGLWLAVDNWLPLLSRHSLFSEVDLLPIEPNVRFSQGKSIQKMTMPS